MSTITFQRYPALGAEVLGIDKARLLEDDGLPGVLMDALEENGVLVFRGLHLDDETQAGLCRRFGEIVANKSDNVPGVSIISLDPSRSPQAEYLKGTFHWHLDGATQHLPPNKATVLTAHAVADQGGETEFASTYAGWDGLSAEEQERLETVRVIHSVEASQRLVIHDPTPEQELEWSRLPRTEQPLVWRHRTGRRSLVLGATALSVVGMEYAEGRALLDELLERTTLPERVYTHEWAVGDTVIWDNCGVLHRALPYDQFSPRDMHRTVLVGDEPIE